LGLDQSDAELSLPKHNIWYYKNYDFDTIKKGMTLNSNELDFAYISFPSSKDPSWKAKHPSTATIQAIGPAKYEWFQEFEEFSWMKRGEDYEAIKSKFKSIMLEKLYQMIPQIEGHVVHAEVSSPLSTRHFTNYSQGEIYGLEHTPARFKLKSLRPKSSIHGLYLAGQDIVTVGVGGALASGLLCATQILKFGMAKQFRAIASAQ
jgi:all-trans-retinol 13,14-reductase